MKAKKLKEIINALPDDMDVFLYNGLVDDFIDIHEKFVETTLIKHKPKKLLELINLQRKEFNKPELSIKDIRKTKWEIENEFLSEEQLKDFSSKKVILINSKIKGETTYDRLGSISY